MQDNCSALFNNANVASAYCGIAGALVKVNTISISYVLVQKQK